MPFETSSCRLRHAEQSNCSHPGFGDTAGLAASVAVIALAGLVLYLVFKRKDWL
jgi:hypothetical protein